ncbi:hypothetical protein GLAREA_06860 [Glarea lozoyensis ATCC 20868]|uniref:Uncharacterized protein n=1 Tax=Glarea lozoyensis (strain ATCC 20868 / MF5171) TaxID=1116229 RepID=S3D5X6_GLAL2|nr:uncharacterized protein GLAREA_06860 [Glarea lozoyensis ATCC 20868]EPE33847.1 hypothetical protein GLAREA_06860 [Glarea lozoyensis ATCC 20868]
MSRGDPPSPPPNPPPSPSMGAADPEDTDYAWYIFQHLLLDHIFEQYTYRLRPDCSSVAESD